MYIDGYLILVDINSIPKISMVVGNYFAVGIISIFFAKHISTYFTRHISTIFREAYFNRISRSLYQFISRSTNTLTIVMPVKNL
jgi:hypothetical protein